MEREGLDEAGRVLAGGPAAHGPPRRISASHLIRRFRQYYPGEYVNAGYRTTDKVIPYYQFQMLMAGIGEIESRRRASAVIEQNTARSITEGDKKAQRRGEDQLKKWIRQGWPEDGG